MCKQLKFLTFAFSILLASWSPQALAATSPNTVRGFVYEWFGLFDTNAPVEDFLGRLDDAGMQIDFPEQTLHSAAEFTGWYQGILATFATATHDVKELTVTPDGAAWHIDLTVEWRAKKFDGGAAEGLFRQEWTVVEAAGGKLLIQRNHITPAP